MKQLELNTSKQWNSFECFSFSFQVVGVSCWWIEWEAGITTHLREQNISAWKDTFNLQGITVKWNSPQDDADQYFLLRVDPATILTSTTSLPGPDEAMTTTQPEPESTTDSQDFYDLRSSTMSDSDRTTASTRRTMLVNLLVEEMESRAARSVLGIRTIPSAKRL